MATYFRYWRACEKRSWKDTLSWTKRHWFVETVASITGAVAGAFTGADAAEAIIRGVTVGLLTFLILVLGTALFFALAAPSRMWQQQRTAIQKLIATIQNQQGFSIYIDHISMGVDEKTHYVGGIITARIANRGDPSALLDWAVSIEFTNGEKPKAGVVYGGLTSKGGPFAIEVTSDNSLLLQTQEPIQNGEYKVGRVPYMTGKLGPVTQGEVHGTKVTLSFSDVRGNRYSNTFVFGKFVLEPPFVPGIKHDDIVGVTRNG